MAAKNSITPAELEGINPLITEDGNTYKVSSVLTSLADMFSEEENRALDHDSAFGFGIASILEVCAAALHQMGNLTEVNHG